MTKKLDKKSTEKLPTEEECEAFRTELKTIAEKAKKSGPFRSKSPEEQKRIREGLAKAMDNMGDALEASGMTDEELEEELNKAGDKYYEKEKVLRAQKKKKDET